MSDWTLAGELEARHMDIVDACKLCRMDRPTMEILVAGGFTLPQLALRVAKALHLTKEQARKLGKPLNPSIWCKKDTGLAMPKRINMMANWVNALDKDKPVEDEIGNGVWLDVAGIARWMWASGRDIGQYYNCQGFRFGEINMIRSDRLRRMRITEAETIMSIPPEVAETEINQSMRAYKVRFVLDTEKIKQLCKGQEQSITVLINRFMESKGGKITRGSANNAVNELKEQIKQGKPVTWKSIKDICTVWRLPMYDIADLMVISWVRGKGGDDGAE